MNVEMDGFPTGTVEDLPEDLDFGNEIPEEDEADEVDDVVEVDEVDEVDEGDVEDDEDDVGDTDEADEVDEVDEEDETETDEDEPSPEPKKKRGKEPFVPKARMDQAIRKARVAEQQAADLAARIAELEAERDQAQAPQPLTAEQIQAKMAEANEALVAGDTAKAAEIQAEMMAALIARPEPPAKVAPAKRDVVTEVEERLEFKQTLQKVYSRFPQLDDANELFDEALGEEAVDLQMAYMNRGYSMSEATVKAAEAIAKIHDLSDVTAEAEQPSAKAAAAKTKQAARTKAKIDKATKAAPRLGGGRGDAEEPEFDIFSATEEEFMALPKAVQDRLLGNAI